MNNTTTTPTAEQLLKKILRVDLLRVPVMSSDRHITRKLQAALARQLFKMLGVKGVSVTAPNYSMAQSVDVRLPKRTDYTIRDEDGGLRNDPAAMMNSAARDKIGSILIRAFPNHDDRSDSQSDYFDFCWSVG